MDLRSYFHMIIGFYVYVTIPDATSGTPILSMAMDDGPRFPEDLNILDEASFFMNIKFNDHGYEVIKLTKDRNRKDKKTEQNLIILNAV